MEKDLLAWLPTGITVIAFIANAAYIKGVFGTKISYHDDCIKNKVDTALCEERHNMTNTRLKDIEIVIHAHDKM